MSGYWQMVYARRANCASLHVAGVSIRDIALLLLIPEITVRSDLRFLGLIGRDGHARKTTTARHRTASDILPSDDLFPLSPRPASGYTCLWGCGTSVSRPMRKCSACEAWLTQRKATMPKE